MEHDENSALSKKYLSAMDSTLGTFQNITEWPDLIAFLGKLHKAFYFLFTTFRR